MKFNSQICTTKEQSERLLALWLKKKTADMYYSHDKGEDIYAIRACWEDFWDSNKLIDGHIRRHCIPAWSIHRLIEMLNYQVIHNSKKYEPVIAIDGMTYQDVCNDDPIVGWSGDLYTDVIDCIQWLIKEGYFNKEYLEE